MTGIENPFVVLARGQLPGCVYPRWTKLYQELADGEVVDPEDLRARTIVLMDAAIKEHHTRDSAESWAVWFFNMGHDTAREVLAMFQAYDDLPRAH